MKKKVLFELSKKRANQICLIALIIVLMIGIWLVPKTFFKGEQNPVISVDSQIRDANGNILINGDVAFLEIVPPDDDTQPPTINSLTADFQNQSLNASWSATDNSGNVPEFKYIIRSNQINLTNWISAGANTSIVINQGQLITYRHNTDYEFALKARDANYNWTNERSVSLRFTDISNPTAPIINDTGSTTNNPTSLTANWTSNPATDLESDIIRYDYMLVSKVGNNETIIQNWQTNALNTSVTINGLTLIEDANTVYYIKVRATNGANLSVIAESDGIIYSRDRRSLNPTHIKTGWNMMSLPEINNNQAFSFMNTIIGARRLHRFNPLEGYVTYNTESPQQFGNAQSGLGYWFRRDSTHSDATISTLRYEYTGTNEVKVNVSTGWNLMGNPFDSETSLNQIKFILDDNSILTFDQATAGAASTRLVQPYLWSYDKNFHTDYYDPADGQWKISPYAFICNVNTYDAAIGNRVTTIQPWHGFWLLVSSDRVKQIQFNR